MTQITIRRLDPLVIEGLKKRAAAAGRSMEEEARQILSDAVESAQIARQRAWLENMEKTQHALFGDKVFPDSTALIREMREERSEYLAEIAKPTATRKSRKP